MDTDFDGTISSEKDIIALDIAMNAVHAVNVSQSLERIVTNKCDLFFSELNVFELFQDLCETTAAHKLHHNPQFVIDQKRVDVLYDVGMFGRFHDTDLCAEEFEVLWSELHLFDGDLTSCG